MAIRQKEFPVRFTPRGLADAFDATDVFPGACQSLKDLIFDQSNPEIIVARPAVSVITSFSGFSNPGVISVQVTIGNITYGMIATTRNAGRDEPFVYDHNASAFVTVSGVTSLNTPLTPSPSGDWTPPTIASIGSKLIFTHPGFSGSPGFSFGVLDISNPAAPAWSSANTTGGLVLPSVPTAVANFNNRAYYALKNTVVYSDVLNPTVVTNATQALTVGDASQITGFAGLPIQTTSSGVIGSLLIFKASQVWQVTGDPADPTPDLALNYISLTTGCSSPRSIINSNLGTYFASNSGPQIISQVVGLMPVIYSANSMNPDVQAPFQNAITPSRVCAGYVGTIYRICMDTVVRGVEATNDYWFDEHKRRWNGPHSFPYDCVSQLGTFSILSSNAHPGALYKSQSFPDSSSSYVENGAALMCNLTSATLPKQAPMSQKQVVESTIELSSAGATSVYNVTGQDDQGAALNSCSITVTFSGRLWGSNIWGDGSLWASSVNVPRVYNVPWTAPLVFQKFQLNVQVAAGAAIAIGTAFMRYQETGYVNAPNPA